MYMTMYMSEHIGEEYDAVISGVTSFGLFAELPNTIEGLIPIESLYGTFVFDPDHFCLIGQDEKYTIGESVRIKVIDVDFYRRRTEFRLLKKYKNSVLNTNVDSINDVRFSSLLYSPIFIVWFEKYTFPLLFLHKHIKDYSHS